MTVSPLTPKPATEHRPIEWFKPDPRELARHDDLEKIRLLGEDMLANGQLQAIGATEDGRVIFGHGRLLAGKSAGFKTLEAKLFPASLSDNQFKLTRAAENLHRKDLNGYQKWIICKELLEGNPGWGNKELAAHLHFDPSMIVRFLCPGRCTPAWNEALAAGKVTLSDCYAASKLEAAEDQDGLLSLKLAPPNGKKLSRDAMEEIGRRKRQPATPTVKMQRVKILTPQGPTMVITGDDLSMQDVVELLAETLKEARKAAEQYDVKTWQSMMKDKAKA